MTTNSEYYAVIAGAGAGGLAIAKGLAKAGKRVLLVEKGPYGGECANFGCIPSRALIASANMAHELFRSARYGIDMRMENYSANRAMQRVRDIVAGFREKNSPEALALLGIETCTGSPAFLDAKTVEITLQDGSKRQVSAQNFVVATGSHPFVPDFKGLTDVPYLTTYNLFDLQDIPGSIAIIGAGKVGCELAQAFRRLGSRVVLIEQKEYMLGREEPEAYKAIQHMLVTEGVEIYLGHQVVRIQKDYNKISFILRHVSDEKEYEVSAQNLALTCGRRPNVANLGLDAAGVAYSDQGIVVDEFGHTSQPHIWAVGDVTGQSFYTHAAENQARTILANLLLPGSFQLHLDSKQPVPRVTFTDPQVASLGLTEEEAIEQFGAHKIAAYLVPLTDADVAVCQGETVGFVKLVTSRYSSKILGATIVSPIASDMLLEISLAMQNRVPLRKLSSLIHPYPTYSQIIRKAADLWYNETIVPMVRKFIFWSE